MATADNGHVTGDVRKPSPGASATTSSPCWRSRVATRGRATGRSRARAGFRLSLQGYDPETPTSSTSSSRTADVASSWATPAAAWSWPSPRGQSRTRVACDSPTDSLDYRILSGVDRFGGLAPGRSTGRPASIAWNSRPIARSSTSARRSRFWSESHITPTAGSEDVTRWVKWSSADESVCRVDDQGEGPGRSDRVKARSWPGSRASWPSPG